MYVSDMERNRAEQTIAHLDTALAEALTPITQFFLHASILKAQGHPLATRCYREWVETMRRSDHLLEGILALGGRPSSREPTRLSLAREAREILALDIALGERWVGALEAAAAGCAAEGAAETVSMLRELIDAERTSLDWRRSQRDELADASAAPAPAPSADGALVESLDAVLRAELSAITQVYYHGQLLEAWGAQELAEFHAKETWEKTWRSLELTERLLGLGAHPREDGHGHLRIGSDVEEVLARDREFVDAQLDALDTALERCDASRSPEIHDLLSRMQTGERAHADWLAARIDEMANPGSGGVIR